MLHSLYIRDFAVIKALELDTVDGLTVLTGETGAGKSILVDALALALGGRADSGVIRHGSERAEVSASFAIKPSGDAARWLKEQDLDADGECLLRRVIDGARGSKGFINGRPVPIQMLRDLGEYLVDIHGQHEHQSLLRRDAQRQLLDDYAGLSDAVAAVGRHYRRVKALQDRIEALNRDAADRGTRLELLRHHVKELEALNLAPNEIAALEEEHGRLANGAELLDGAHAVVQALDADDDSAATHVVAQATRKLEGLAHFDPRLGEIAMLLSEAGVQIDEAASRLQRYVGDLDLDPARLQWLDARLGTIHDLARKHRVKAEELPPLLQKFRTELADTEDLDGNLARLNDELKQTRAEYTEAAAVVSAGRTRAAKTLARAVTDRMQHLGMAGGRFRVDLTPLPNGELSSHGAERVEFQVTANADLPLRPLNKVASGGELSRISLALQVVAAGVARIPTLIFDEVDVGVGGRVAEIVGQQLRALAAKRQVLCITHLPQVAALGEHHLRIAKSTQAGATDVTVDSLKKSERVQEIARMLGGIEISQKTIAHAEDMLSRATV
ncbi:MAG TPA: DNA repair protein RecN [Burkholderiales bacterium]